LLPAPVPCAPIAHEARCGASSPTCPSSTATFPATRIFLRLGQPPPTPQVSDEVSPAVLPTHTEAPLPASNEPVVPAAVRVRVRVRIRLGMGKSKSKGAKFATVKKIIQK
jgi:hypothetical protein